MTTRTLVIVGASLGGAKAAEGARDAGFEGRVLLIGEEHAAPYERPPLSKDVLRGEKEPESARVHPEGFYAEHDIELVIDKVTGLDTTARTVTLASGDVVPFDVAVLTTGAAPRRLTVPGADLAGVRYLRSVDDSLALQAAIRSSSRVAIIGAGWIGSEVAASARQIGAEVVVVDPLSVPLQRVVGAEIGEVFRRLHADHGVELRLGAGVTELRGGESVEEVVLSDGRVEAADVVVVGIGVTPRTELAEVAGLPVDNGIMVDEYLSTEVEGVLAAGDVANAFHPHYRHPLRIEHWANALNQGTAAGRNAAGAHEAYSRLPYFFSDQYDLGLEYVGHNAPDDRVVTRGDVAERQFTALWQRDGVVTAAMNVNVWEGLDELKEMIERREPVDPERFADPDVPLSAFVS